MAAKLAIVHNLSAFADTQDYALHNNALVLHSRM